MSLIDILMPAPMQSYVYDGIAGRYRVHRLWESADPQALLSQIKGDVQFILTSPMGLKITSDYMSQFPKLKGVINFGVGYDAIDARWAGEHGIIVTNTPDVLNAEVADCALGLTLSVIRQLPQADLFVREGQWASGHEFPLSASLAGCTMGIMGLGRIGKEIARRAEAFGLKIIYNGRHQQQGVTYPYYASLKDMAADCDILMLIAPGTAETKHVINAEILEALGPEGVLINMARGSLIDDDALIEALEQRKILSAGLDVYTAEYKVPERLKALPHVVLLPHIGSSSVATRKAINKLVVDNLDALAQGQRPLTPVPETPVG